MTSDRVIAVHEAGHAVVASRVGFAYECIIREYGAHPRLVPAEEQSRAYKDARDGFIAGRLTDEQRASLLKHVQVALAGCSAENVVADVGALLLRGGSESGRMDRLIALSSIRVLHGRSFWVTDANGQRACPGDEDLTPQEATFYSVQAKEVYEVIRDDLETVLAVADAFQKHGAATRDMVQQLLDDADAKRAGERQPRS
jgi:hypothetical protein